jgi:hypothetical protein
LKRLLDLQSKARHDRIFGGFSTAGRLNTIKEKLVFTIWKPNFRRAQGPQQSGITEAEDQRRECNKTSEADIPRAEAKQPYRKRENDSASGLIDLPKSGHESEPRSEPKTDRE